MKYIKLFESKTLVDRKIDLLDTIFLDLYDQDFEFTIVKGTIGLMNLPIFTDYDLDSELYPTSVSIGFSSPSKLIYVIVTKQIIRFSESDRKVLDDFTGVLRGLGMNTRGGFGGDNFRVFYFDKWGIMTNSNLL